MGVDSISVSGSVDVGTSLEPVTVESVGPVGPVTVAGIPDSFEITITDPLPAIHLNIDNIAPIHLTMDPLTINPLDLSLRLKEVPNVRVHLPANFCVGLALLGVELLTVRLCGEAQAITEPYDPNPCEICEPTGPPGSAPPVGSVLSLRE